MSETVGGTATAAEDTSLTSPTQTGRMSTFVASHAVYPRRRFRVSTSLLRDIDAVIDTIRRSSKVGLHLGAGDVRIPGLINCDLYNPGADKKLDGTRLDEFNNGSVDLIETHHMIEHLSFEDASDAIAEWARVLKPGGYLIITCPDMTRVALHWVKLALLRLVGRGSEERNYALKMFYGSQEHVGMFHRSGYDRHVLSQILLLHGLNVEFAHTPYPRRTTPSLLVIAKKL